MKPWLLTGVLAFLLAACDDTATNVSEGNEVREAEPLPAEFVGDEVGDKAADAAGIISLRPMEPRSPPFPDAALRFKEPAPPITPGRVPFDFDVANFDLGTPTEPRIHEQLASAEQGQHIHLLLNNNPYTAHYQADFSQRLTSGHYVVLAFLSRAWHESLKHDGAFVLTDLMVGQGQNQMADLTAPHLFYSRPKGEYSGEAAQAVMLDFYLVNTRLSEDGHRVIATINGETFTLTDWVPYIIEGLAEGEATIHLKLVDARGDLVSSPFNPVERTITVSP